MPGVAVLHMSPALGGYGSPPHSATSNGFPRIHDETSVLEIKDRAKEDANRLSRGASAISLLGAAKSQFTTGQEYELSENLRDALSAYMKSATLVTICMNSAEYKTESQRGNKGALYKQVNDFMKRDGEDIMKKVTYIQERLASLERTSKDNNEPEDGGKRKSIADRVKSLQDAGMAVSTSKRYSRELPTALTMPSTPPMSPDSGRSRRFSQSHPMSPSVPTSSGLVTPILPNSSGPSPHTLVPPSSLGPPSPTSSTSSSPLGTYSSLGEFTTAFPSIDELDEMEGLKLPSVPTGPVNDRSPRPEPSPRYFPMPPVDPGPRPSSTPLTPTGNALVSRPASPAIPRKPSGLGLTSTTFSSAKIDLPVTNSVFPQALQNYLQQGLQVLFLAVLTREDFDREHIKADAQVCLEPSVLSRETLTTSVIEDSLVIAPPTESVVFKNRDKFDLIVIYDEASESFGSQSSPIPKLIGAIHEKEFSRNLKRIPVLLVGGLQAWKRLVGSSGVVRGESVVHAPEPRKLPAIPDSMPVLSPKPTTAFSAVSPPVSFGAMSTRGRSNTLDKGPSAPSLHQRNEDQSRAMAEASNGTRPPVGGAGLTNGYHLPEPVKPLRRQPISRPGSISASPSMYTGNALPSVSSHSPMVNGSSSIQYPQYPQYPQRTMSPALSQSGSPFTHSTGDMGLVSPPPLASINPTISRRRSEFIDQSNEAVSGLNTARQSIGYPDLSARSVLRPPPVAASSTLERQDNRPRALQHRPSFSLGPTPPTIPSDYPVTYWSDMQIGTSGLKNLGNTCYMNATIQCLSATVPFARFFTDGRWKSAVNMVNPLGTKGNLANAFASILHEMWQGELPYLSPVQFRRSICMHASQFGGSDQHDSQEFLIFLLDGLHEDLNRILHKTPYEPTPEREEQLERLPQQIASEQEWKIYRMRNDSLIVDFFHGQFRNRLECLTCHKTSTTYNSFMYLTLPVPTGKGSTKVPLQQCLDAFVREEVMEKTDAWHCPNCKALRRATKRLSLSRLPPVLLIHLKRFSFKGPFTDKIETFVDFPLKNLDLTNYMPPPLPPGADKMQLNGGRPMPADDPRTQMPPYKYDLYGVTNHFGSLNTGHYTAFISSRGGWKYCDDSRVVGTEAKEVVGRPAYVLFYKRIQA